MLSSFDITKKWPPTNPKAIQLYSLPTPNGVKVSVMLEEIGLDYEAHRVDCLDRRPDVPGVLVTQPQQQDSRHHRSGRPVG
jgi:GST-like protein